MDIAVVMPIIVSLSAGLLALYSSLSTKEIELKLKKFEEISLNITLMLEGFRMYLDSIHFDLENLKKSNIQEIDSKLLANILGDESNKQHLPSRQEVQKTIVLLKLMNNSGAVKAINFLAAFEDLRQKIVGFEDKQGKPKTTLRDIENHLVKINELVKSNTSIKNEILTKFQSEYQ
ncbi:hypothetical protein, partial [Klebsiella michiganensis]